MVIGGDGGGPVIGIVVGVAHSSHLWQFEEDLLSPALTYEQLGGVPRTSAGRCVSLNKVSKAVYTSHRPVSCVVVVHCLTVCFCSAAALFVLRI